MSVYAKRITQTIRSKKGSFEDFQSFYKGILHSLCSMEEIIEHLPVQKTQFTKLLQKKPTAILPV